MCLHSRNRSEKSLAGSLLARRARLTPSTTSRKTFKDVSSFINEADSRAQVEALEQNVKEFGLTYFGMSDKRQGIVHIIGPEQGFTLPGTTVVCGDSHTSTHGAFGALAFGIGTSEVEHVLATQTLPQAKSKNMRINVEGKLPEGVASKDIVLHIIGVIGTAGGTGCVIEFSGSAIRALSMEARMSICNMAIEAGARAGMIAPDDITFEYLKGRPLSPAGEEWDKAEAYWRSLKSDEGAKYDIEIELKAEDIIPTVTWGTSPQDVVPITGKVPVPSEMPANKRQDAEKALKYMGLEAGQPMEEVKVDKVFFGSCTNGRIEDMRSAARVIVASGKNGGPTQVAEGVYAMVVPGSGLVKRQAEAEGLDVIFKKAGFDWREAGCSMCLGMNPDQLKPGERCASTSNRNFEGRQGAGGRTHLVSPAMATAAALTGRLTDVRKLMGEHVSDDGGIKISKYSDFLEPLIPASAAASSEEAREDPDEQAKAEPAPSGEGQPKFTVVKGIAAPMWEANIDTDKIIPKQFLKTLLRTGLGSALFWPARYDVKTGEPIPDFVLNREPFTKSKLLVCTGPNFGCGSSREHAPWALNDFGIRCVMAPSFGDIFKNNCFKNGMLPLELPQDALEQLYKDAESGAEIAVDLVNECVVRPNGEKIAFKIDPFRRHCLVNGLDDIGLTLQNAKDIDTFEAKRTANWPWLDGAGYAKGNRVVPLRQKAAKNDW